MDLLQRIKNGYEKRIEAALKEKADAQSEAAGLRVEVAALRSSGIEAQAYHEEERSQAVA